MTEQGGRKPRQRVVRPEKRVALVYPGGKIEIKPLRTTMGDRELEPQELVHTLVMKSPAWRRLEKHLAGAEGEISYPLAYQRTSVRRTASSAKGINGISYHRDLIAAVSEHGVNVVMDAITRARSEGLDWRSEHEGGTARHLDVHTFRELVAWAAGGVRYEVPEDEEDPERGLG